MDLRTLFEKLPSASDLTKSDEKTDDTKNDTKKKKKTPKRIRSNVFEVMQEMDKLDPALDFDACIAKTGSYEDMRLIHTGETYDEKDLLALKAKGADMSKYKLGAPKKDHIHIFLHFKTPATLPKVAKAFGVEPQYVQAWTGKNAWENAVSYLTHRTAGAEHKKQYDPADVIANFDYAAKLQAITDQVAKVDTKSKKKLLETQYLRLFTAYDNKEFSKSVFDKKIRDLGPDMAYYASARDQRLEKETERLNRLEVADFLADFTQDKRVLWIQGASGMGKTSTAIYMADHFAKRRFPDEPARGNSYQLISGDRDVFQFYEPTQHTLILDELKAKNGSNMMSPSGWLDFLDPHQLGNPLSARYHNKVNCAGVIIIASSMDPITWWYSQCGLKHDDLTDSTAQSTLVSHFGSAYVAHYGKYDPFMLDSYMDNLQRTNDPNFIKQSNFLQALAPGFPWNAIVGEGHDPYQFIRRVNFFKLFEKTSLTGDSKVLIHHMEAQRHWDGSYYLQPEDDYDWSLEEVWACRKRKDFKGWTDQMMDEKQFEHLMNYDTRLSLTPWSAVTKDRTPIYTETDLTEHPRDFNAEEKQLAEAKKKIEEKAEQKAKQRADQEAEEKSKSKPEPQPQNPFKAPEDKFKLPLTDMNDNDISITFTWGEWTEPLRALGDTQLKASGQTPLGISASQLLRYLNDRDQFSLQLVKLV